MHVDPLFYPPEDLQAEAAFGRFVIAWAVLDSEIDRLIGEMLRVDVTAGMKVASGLTLRGKLKLLRSLFSDLRDLPPPFAQNTGREKSFDDLCKATETLNDRRNEIIHGHVAAVEHNGEPVAFWVKWSGGKSGITGAAMVMGAGMFDDDAQLCRELAQAWNDQRRSLSSILTGFALADADALLSAGAEGPETLTWQILTTNDSRKSTRS